MRLTTAILIATLMQVSASSLAQKITLQKSRVQLKTILQDIRKQSGYNFVYTDVLLQKAEPVTINVKAAELDEVLEQIFEQQPLTYEINNKTVVVKEKTPSFLDKVIDVISNDRRDLIADIRGVVRNERGEALEGITVMVKGAKTGTRTNAKGEFVLKGVKRGDVLLFTGVAIEPFEYTVKDDKNIELNLKARLVQLEEVAVNYSTGYQKIPKERATGSFVFIDSATINRRVDANIFARLKDLVPGLLFDTRRDGGIGERLQLRGMYSFSEDLAAPLIVVDNFPYEGDINNINPNNVENITILRDAAAASIWGAKAGNGVIVITTKQGRFNQNTQISINSSIAFAGKPDLFKLPIVSSTAIVDLEQFLFGKGIYNAALNNPSARVSKVALILDQLRKGQISDEQSNKELDVLRNTDIRNDLLKYSYRNKIAQSHAINFSGGSNLVKYFLSIGYNKDLSSLKRNENERFTINSNNTIRLLKNLEMQTALSFNSDLITNNNTFQYASSGLNIPNYYNLADANGNALSIPQYFKQSFIDTIGNGKLLDWNYRPLDELWNNDNTTKIQTLTGRINLNYDMFEGLNLNLDYQYLKTKGTNRLYESIDSYYARNLINMFSNFSADIPIEKRYPVPIGGVLDLNNNELSSHNLRAGFSYEQNWNEKHQINIIGGAELAENKSNYNKYRNYGYNDELSTTSLIDYVSLFPTFSGFMEQIPSITAINSKNNRTTSIYANGAYTYNNRYTFSGSIRKDAANVLGLNTNKRGRPFWHLGLLWKVDKESFYPFEFLSSINLRSSFGNGGNTRFGSSALTTIGYFASSVASNSVINLPFADINNIGNPDLRWEKVSTFNMALDFEFKNRRISGSIDYYRKKSTDVLANRLLDPTTGTTLIEANSASIKGNGIDLKLNAKVIKSSSFNWDISGNVSIAKFIVYSYLYDRNLTGQISDGNLNPILGYTPYLLTSYKWMGLDPINGDPQGMYDGKISKDWATINNSTPFSDQVKNGSSVPTTFGNLISNIHYNGFTLSTNLIYKFNCYFRRPTFAYNPSRAPAGISRLSNEYEERWKVSGDELHTNVPSFTYPFSISRDIFYGNSEARVEKGDNIRIDDFSLSYGISKSAFRKLPFSNFRITANFSNLNLILWKATKTDLDPLNPAGNIAPKNMSLAVNLTF